MLFHLDKQGIGILSKVKPLAWGFSPELSGGGAGIQAQFRLRQPVFPSISPQKGNQKT